MLNSSLTWILIGILIASGIVAILLFVVRKEEFKRKPDYRILFIVGSSWIPIGFTINFWPIGIVGTVLMVWSLANRKHWKKDETWKNMPKAKKQIKLAIVLALSLSVAVGVGLFVLSDAEELQVSFIDELELIYPDKDFDERDHIITTDIPRGAIAGAHILIKGTNEAKKLRIRISGLPHNLRTKTSLYQLLSVPVSENTGLDSRTEKFTGQKNPYVVRKAPFSVFEVLKPIDNLFDLPAHETTALRIEIRINEVFPEEETPITVHIGGLFNGVKLKFIPRPSPIQIPEMSTSFNYVNWHSNKNIATDHEVEMWSKQHWKLLRAYAELMAKGRQNTFWFHWTDFFTIDANAEISEFHADRFGKYVQTFLDAGLITIQGAPFTRRISWSEDGMLVSLPGENSPKIYTDSPEGESLILGMFQYIQEEMKEKGWIDLWYQGVFDEPTSDYATRYKAVVKLLKKTMPKLRILEATMTTDLVGEVDAWCPQVHEFQNNKTFFTERQNEKDEVWVYTCLVPGGPWINRLVDQERLRPVYVGWAGSHYNLDGFLHWGLNHHRGKPFTELVVQHGDEKNYLPAGDSHIVYPGKTGPWSSQRFEAHRIGMEDYELLELLKSKNPERAKEITETLFRAFNDYDKSVPKYRETRKTLLQELSR